MIKKNKIRKKTQSLLQDSVPISHTEESILDKSFGAARHVDLREALVCARCALLNVIVAVKMSTLIMCLQVLSAIVSQ